jgi:guanylate kinase
MGLYSYLKHNILLTTAMIFTLSGPRGVGKSTVAEMLREVAGVGQIVAYATRGQRPGEVDGVDYHFVDHPTFDRIRKLGRGMFDVLDTPDGSRGTPYHVFEEAASTDPSGIEDIKIVNVALETALRLRQEFGEAAVKTMFIIPKCWRDIGHQMRAKNLSEDEINRRLHNEPTDLTLMTEVDTIIVNGRERIVDAFHDAAHFIMEHSGVELNTVSVN